MSWQATNWVITNSKHKGSALLTMLMIANCANESGADAFPGIEKLARDTRLNERQVRRIIDALAASGELTVKQQIGRVHHYAFPLMSADIMSGVRKEATLDIAMSETPDILTRTPDIAMSTDPSVERSLTVTHVKVPYDQTTAGKRSALLSARSGPTRIDSRPKKIPVPESPDSATIKTLIEWGARMEFSEDEMKAMWKAFYLKHVDEKTPPQTSAEWGIKFQRYVANCNVSKTQRQRPA